MKKTTFRPFIGLYILPFIILALMTFILILSAINHTLLHFLKGAPIFVIFALCFILNWMRLDDHGIKIISFGRPSRMRWEEIREITPRIGLKRSLLRVFLFNLRIELHGHNERRLIIPVMMYRHVLPSILSIIEERTGLRCPDFPEDSASD